MHGISSFRMCSHFDTPRIPRSILISVVRHRHLVVSPSSPSIRSVKLFLLCHCGLIHFNAYSVTKLIVTTRFSQQYCDCSLWIRKNWRFFIDIIVDSVCGIEDTLLHELSREHRMTRALLSLSALYFEHPLCVRSRKNALSAILYSQNVSSCFVVSEQRLFSVLHYTIALFGCAKLFRATPIFDTRSVQKVVSFYRLYPLIPTI